MYVLQVSGFVHNQNSLRSHTYYKTKATCRSVAVAGMFNDVRGIVGERNNAVCDDEGEALVRCCCVLKSLRVLQARL